MRGQKPLNLFIFFYILCSHLCLPGRENFPGTYYTPSTVSANRLASPTLLQIFGRIFEGSLSELSSALGGALDSEIALGRMALSRGSENSTNNH